jgi:type I restriction enzyme S subunit
MQNTIANILSAFDDKIENNNKINENLEELAQALYKHWFVDFEFPNEEGKPYKSSGGEMIESELGLIPKGWKVKEVSNLFDFVGGSQPPKKEHIYEESKGYIRFIQNRDYSGNNSYLTYIKESPRNKLCNQFDILMDKYGEAGKVRFGISGAYNVALAKINSKIEDREILRRFFEQKHIERYILNASQASTRPSVNKTVFTNMKIIYPAEIIKKTFSELSLDVIKHNLNLKKENSKLAEMRDLLLPKLMSGEIKVPVKG